MKLVALDFRDTLAQVVPVDLPDLAGLEQEQAAEAGVHGMLVVNSLSSPRLVGDSFQDSTARAMYRGSVMPM